MYCGLGYLCSVALFGVGIHFKFKANKCVQALEDVEDQRDIYSVTDLKRQKETSICGSVMEGGKYRAVTGMLVRSKDLNKGSEAEQKKRLKRCLKRTQDTNCKLV